jgi:hypothetical protein
VLFMVSSSKPIKYKLPLKASLLGDKVCDSTKMDARHSFS